MTLTPTKGTDMAFLLLVLLYWFPSIGLMTDRDNDGVRTFKDCNDRDPSLQVTWCLHGVCGMPETCECLEPGRLHQDPNYEQVWCPELGKVGL